jgi:tetratricopeptide (TPR) repeat protein
MDVEDIAPGDPFGRTIDDTLSRCNIALVVIGPRWAEILHQRAHQQPRDYVCHEIEAALARQIIVVPVLVGGANVAELAGLPDRISALSQYEAAELRDSTFGDDCTRLAKSLGLEPSITRQLAGRKVKPALKFVLGTAVLIGLLLAASGWLGVGPWNKYRERRAAISQMFATAKTEADRGEYESAFKTYQDLLKTDPGNRAARDQQVDVAMGWLDDFHVIASDGGDLESLAGTRLSEIIPVLDAGLAKANGQRPRAADILAHIGWAHWLNQKLAHREFGPRAERDLRLALQLDPVNVFAHAMLGNWIMQTGGRTEEALMHFRIAVEGNRARPLVRQMQMGVLVYPRDRETRTAVIRLANEMRRNGEPIDDQEKNRILTAYDPTVNSAEELSETLSAVPANEAWPTYLWLDTRSTDGANLDYQRLEHDFIYASILEIERKREDALSAFQRLRTELKGRRYDGRIVTYVDDAIRRLSTR